MVYSQTKEMMIVSYRDIFQKHGDGPEASGMSSEGQRFRFGKLMEIADLQDRRILDLGCGIGAFYPYLIAKFGQEVVVAGHLPADHGQDLNNVKKFRLVADYSAESVDPGDAAWSVERAEAFVAAVKKKFER